MFARLYVCYIALMTSATLAAPLPAHKTNITAFPEVTLNTTFGFLKGLLFEKHAEFLGVPYATNQRFEPPQDIFSYRGGYTAKRAPPACPQYPGVIPQQAPTAEDCLYLNIFIPRTVLQGELTGVPVMLFFPGGAFYQGSASQGIDFVGWDGIAPYNQTYGYNASSLIFSNNGSMIVITANYRLGKPPSSRTT